MKKLTNLILIFCFAISLQAKTVTKTMVIHFDTDKFTLREHATLELEKFIIENLTDQEYAITIKGHTDNIGDIAYNNELSLNRAQSVRAKLRDLGLDEKLISLSFSGELDPEMSNSSDVNRQVNRRVEVKFTTYSFDNLSELEQELQPNKKNVFTLDPSKENVVEGRRGVKVFIAPNTFTYEDGSPVTEKVKFELTEALDYADFISSGLLTKTDEGLLESGGMLRIEAATVGGKPVVARKDNPMVVLVPTANRKKEMEVFTSDVGATWVGRSQPISSRFILNQQNFPKMKNKFFKYPKYKYKGVKSPEKPRSPVCVNKPHEPRLESYMRPFPWYKFFGKKDARARQERSYLASMERYDKRMLRFDRLHKEHEIRLESHTEALCMYNQDMEEWEANKVADKANFKQSPAYKAVEALNIKAREKNMVIYKNAIKKWRKENQRQMAAQGDIMDKLGVTNKNELDNYVFAMNDLKWINVDRFYHMKPNQKQVLVMKADKISDEKVLVLFNNIKSMMPMSANPATNTYSIEDFPKKEPAVIFAYKVENGRPLLCYQVVDGSKEYHLDYEPSSFREIKAILKSFENV